MTYPRRLNGPSPDSQHQTSASLQMIRWMTGASPRIAERLLW